MCIDSHPQVHVQSEMVPSNKAQKYFIQPSKKYSLSIYYILRNLLDAGDSVAIKENKVPERDKLDT